MKKTYWALIQKLSSNVVESSQESTCQEYQSITREINESIRQATNMGYVRAPHLIGPVDAHIVQQIWASTVESACDDLVIPAVLKLFTGAPKKEP